MEKGKYLHNHIITVALVYGVGIPLYFCVNSKITNEGIKPSALLFLVLVCNIAYAELDLRTKLLV